MLGHCFVWDLADQRYSFPHVEIEKLRIGHESLGCEGLRFCTDPNLTSAAASAWAVALAAALFLALGAFWVGYRFDPAQASLP